MIAWTHTNWGFGIFFLILAVAAAGIFGIVVLLLPKAQALDNPALHVKGRQMVRPTNSALAVWGSL